MRITPYYLSLIQQFGAPLFKQVIPDIKELDDSVCVPDPLDEENLSPVPNLVHRYPDRALFLVSNQCAMYCRFCTRKRKVGTASMTVNDDTIEAGIDYIRRTPSIHEVLLSGGDPLMLEDHQIDSILSGLHKIPTIEVIRIGTRIPCALPMRITPQLINILKRYHPLYINTHFNHPAEITPQAAYFCGLLADAGIPLGNHTVLLSGINDSVSCIRELMRKLLRNRIKPYYLFQADLTCGTDHFRTPIDTGFTIMRGLIGHISGMAVPTFALDAPGGKGKIRLLPDSLLSQGESLVFKTYTGEICSYPEVI